MEWLLILIHWLYFIEKEEKKALEMWVSIKVQTMWLKGSTDLWVIARDNNFSSFIAMLFKQDLHYWDHPSLQW